MPNNEVWNDPFKNQHSSLDIHQSNFWRCIDPENQANKNGKPNIAPLQPPTLAVFRPWGSSAGAGRADLPLQK